MRVLVDMDGTLVDFDGGFLVKWRETHPDKPFIPLEDRKTFYLTDQYPCELREAIWGVFTQPGYFRDLPPISGGIAALHEMERRGLEVFICTSPLDSYQHCVPEKYEWIEAHLGYKWTKQVVMTKDKTLIQGDILIDDKPTIQGVTTPVWEHVLYDQVYNRDMTGRRRITWANWQSIL